MRKLSADEIQSLAIEAAKTLDSTNNAPYFKFDEAVRCLYRKYVRALEVIEEQEKQE